MKKTKFDKKRYIIQKMKVMGIVKNDITGVKYGLVEIPIKKEAVVSLPHCDKETSKGKQQKNTVLQKNTHTKTEQVEKETKSATKPAKRRYRLRATIVCSYNFKSSRKKPIDLAKKRFRKAKTLLKNKQRKEKIELQNLALKTIAIEPILDFIEILNSIKQKTR
ncbi:MAG: hypothetical protein IK122_03095 [Alphaproteobacteria bacterium]|nr:hypothetical protein [Alphaproteobacteria bacterium]